MSIAIANIVLSINRQLRAYLYQLIVPICEVTDYKCPGTQTTFLRSPRPHHKMATCYRLYKMIDCSKRETQTTCFHRAYRFRDGCAGASNFCLPANTPFGPRVEGMVEPPYLHFLTLIECTHISKPYPYRVFT
jgi:hypothetical protein